MAATVLTVAPILSFPNITTTVQATTKKAQAAKNTIQVNKAPIIYDRAGNYLPLELLALSSGQLSRQR